MKTRLSLMFTALALGVSIIGARAQGTAFTYQGRLNDGANPANGIYDLRFAIYDSTNNPGVLIAGPLTNAASVVSNGLFTVTLDFGAGVFDGMPRFLEIGVRTNGGVAFTVLAPRQALTPTPYAIFANTASNLLGVVSSGQLSGTYSGPVQFNNGANSFNGTFVGQFFGSTFTGGNFTGNFLGSGSGLFDVWHTGGNSGTTPASFLGTTDNQPVVIKVNGQEAMRYQPTTETPDVIGGWSGNYVQPNLLGVTIGGGGSVNPYQGQVQPNVVTNNGNYAVIAGGYHNMVTNYGGTILGGSVNLAGGNFATIGGGQFSTNLGDYSVIAGGFQNWIDTNDYENVIGGGYLNVIGPNGYENVIGGGYFNSIGSNNFESVIAGGAENSILVAYSSTFIGGGFLNTISTNGYGATIVAGDYNTNNGTLSFIGAGDVNLINANQSVIGGGEYNSINTGSTYGTIPGGANNTIQAGAFSSTIGGGYGNTIQGGGFNSIIGGGFTNTISSNAADTTISGGSFNVIGPNANLSAISGGTGNNVTGQYSFIGGGIANLAAGFLSTSVGGQGNSAAVNNSTVVGGLFNTNFGVLGFIGGGDNNLAFGFGSVISGGESNRAFGQFSMAAGYHAGAFYDGTFVWSDFEPASQSFNATSTNQFLIRAQNGVGINTNNPQAALHVNGTIIANNFSGSGSSLSGLNFSQLTGTLLDGQLSGNYSSPVGFNNAGNSFTGSGAGLTSLNASSLSSGTVADARLSANIPTLNGTQTFTGPNTFSGNTFLNGFVGFGTSSGIGSANFVMSQTTFGSGFGGMYINTTSPTGRPFYGYALNTGIAAFHYVDGNDGNKWKLDNGGVRLVVTTSGNVGIGNTSPTNLLMVGLARCDGSSWINVSDRNLKENFTTINAKGILEKVAQLPITIWNYKTDNKSVHLGPVAQDFRAAFQLGADDVSIATVDESGVALAAIQGLNQKLEEQRGELKQKETEITELKQRLEKLEQIMSQRNRDSE